MKVLLSPIDYNHLEIAKDTLYRIYFMQLAADNEVISNNDLFSAQTIIENVLREYTRTIEGIKGTEV